jgi:hypothetical protein
MVEIWQQQRALYMKTCMRFGARKWLGGESSNQGIPSHPRNNVMIPSPSQAGASHPAHVQVINTKRTLRRWYCTSKASDQILANALELLRHAYISRFVNFYSRNVSRVLQLKFLQLRSHMSRCYLMHPAEINWYRFSAWKFAVRFSHHLLDPPAVWGNTHSSHVREVAAQHGVNSLHDGDLTIFLTVYGLQLRIYFYQRVLVVNLRNN